MAVFLTTLRVGTAYTAIVQDTIGPGQSDTLSFPGWSALVLGSFPVMCYTAMPGDMNPANDTLVDSVTVVRAASFDVAVIRY